MEDAYEYTVDFKNLKKRLLAIASMLSSWAVEVGGHCVVTRTLLDRGMSLAISSAYRRQVGMGIMHVTRRKSIIPNWTQFHSSMKNQ